MLGCYCSVLSASRGSDQDEKIAFAAGGIDISQGLAEFLILRRF